MGEHEVGVAIWLCDLLEYMAWFFSKNLDGYTHVLG